MCHGEGYGFQAVQSGIESREIISLYWVSREMTLKNTFFSSCSTVIVTEFLENSESGIRLGFLVFSLVQGCKMHLNWIWFGVPKTVSSSPPPPGDLLILGCIRRACWCPFAVDSRPIYNKMPLNGIFAGCLMWPHLFPNTLRIFLKLSSHRN